MKSHHPHLSPLHFQRFVDLAHRGESVHPMAEPKKREAEYVSAYRCTECREIYEYRDEAEDCCPIDSTDPNLDKWSCPICGEECATAHIAADCCLWLDYCAQDRWRMANAVEAGSTWAEQLGIDTESLPNFWIRT